MKKKTQRWLRAQNPQELCSDLISVTIGSGERFDAARARKIFQEYLRCALPDVAVTDIEPIDTAAALNSVSAFGEMIIDGRKQRVFMKVHVESGTESLSPLGAKEEYRNAQMLESAGWPVLKPYVIGTNPDYPILIYPRIDADTLFQKLERSYQTGTSEISDTDIRLIEKMNRQIGGSTTATIRSVSAKKAISAPVQNLFWERFKPGRRIDQWYTDGTEFLLPGLGTPITWESIKKAEWQINGETYEKTLGEIIRQAQTLLAFAGEQTALVATSHGDDHAGNVFIDRAQQKAFVFDPAFAGQNPLILCDVKALAHTGFLPMAGMYYNPKLSICSYQWDERSNTLKLEVDFNSSPIYEIHERLARQIMDTRIVPLLQRASELKADMEREKSRFCCALTGCALLTINIPLLLEQRNYRGIGLLPMAMMFSELRGLPVLKELNDRFNRLVV